MAQLVSQRIELPDDYDAVQNLYLERGWSDGLPITPPTPERVEAMLSSVSTRPAARGGPTSPQLGRRHRGAAGYQCGHGRLPSRIPARHHRRGGRHERSRLQPLRHPGHYPLLRALFIVNGPIRERLGLNGSSGAYGPGWRANATIGRAVRLALLNIGGGHPGVGDMSTQGAPSKYTYCVAENEEANPWEPLHVERGYSPDQSTVTVVGGEPPHNINDHTGATAEEILTIIAGAMAVTGANNAYTGGETLLALGPEHAATMVADGFTKADIRDWLHHHARVPLERYTEATMLERFGQIPDGPVPMVATPEDLAIIVLGGPGKHSSWVPTFGGATQVGDAGDWVGGMGVTQRGVADVAETGMMVTPHRNCCPTEEWSDYEFHQ